MGSKISITNDGTWSADDQRWCATRMGREVNRSVTLDLSLFTADHCVDGFIPSGTVLAKHTSTGYYGPYTPAVDESVSLAITATGGTYTLTFDGETTAAIAFNANAAAIQAALEGLSNLDPGDVVVTGTGPYVITFGEDFANQNVPNLTVGTGSLTGGSATATVTAGGTTAELGTAAGHLFWAVKMASGDTDKVTAAVYWTGVVAKGKLPNFTSTADGKGELDAAAEALLGNFIRYEA